MPPSRCVSRSFLRHLRYIWHWCSLLCVQEIQFRRETSRLRSTTSICPHINRGRPSRKGAARNQARRNLWGSQCFQGGNGVLHYLARVRPRKG
jgi:hypothetical protein